MIEGGAVVKVRDDASLVGLGGNILIKGTPFNYALFTKESDNTVGETVTPANSNDVDNFLWFYFTPDTSLQVQFAKFAHSSIAIWINSASNGEGGFIEIRDSIFRDCIHGVGGDFYMESRINIFNCLFDNSYVNLRAYNDHTLNAYIQNCTFNGRAIMLNGSKFRAIFQNNFYANMPYAVSGNATFESGSCINYDATYNITSRLAASIATALTNAGGTSTPTNTGSSFVTCSNGDHYLGEPGTGNIYPNTTDANLSSEYKARLNCTTVRRPADMSNSSERSYLSRPVTGNWCDRWTDFDTPDIGFHYDIVHGLVDASGYFVEINGNFDLQPGIVLSFNQEKGLNIKNGATFKSNGLPNKRIRYLGINATCDNLKDPYNNINGYGLNFDAGTNLECDFSEFGFLYRGFYIAPVQNCVVKNNIFRYNTIGAFISNDSKHCSFQNCLFFNNSNAIQFSSVGTSDFNIAGCTFNNNDTAVNFTYDTQGATICNTVVEDNIFSNNVIAVDRDSTTNLTIHDITRNNIFWNNEMDVAENSINLEDESNQLETNPLYAHRAAISGGDVLQNWNTDKDAPYDGYYLSQRSGDASRRPFVFREGQILAEEDGVEIEGIVNKQGGVSGVYWLYVTAGFPTEDLEKEDDHRCVVTADGSNVYQYCRGIQTIGGPLFLMFYFDGDVQFNENAHISLTFENGQVLNIYLPTITEDTFMHFLFLWVAEDGSTFWAEESQGPVYEGNERDYMEAWYSLRWHESNLARGVYDGRFAVAGGSGHESEADSPAVDAGSKDWLNGGTTKTIIIDGNQQPDNSPPPLRGGYDNYDPGQNNAPVAWESSPVTQGTGDDLDIGYHYWGAGYNVNDNYTVVFDDIEKVVTLRHPKEAVGKFYHEILGQPRLFYPAIGNDIVGINAPERFTTLGTGYYQGEDFTMMCYWTNFYSTDPQQADDLYSLVCYNRFRGNENQKGVVTELYPRLMPYHTEEYFQCDAFVRRVTLGASAGATGSTPNQLYLIVLIDWRYIYGVYCGSEIQVYRYKPGSEEWVLIGDHIDYEPDGKGIIYDAALATDGNDLVVSWIQEQTPYSNIAHIRGYRIFGASGLEVKDNSFNTGGNELYQIQRQLPAFVVFESSVVMDWDNNILKPRIAWHEYDTNMGKFIAKAGRVIFNSSDQPYLINNTYQISSNYSGGVRVPTITVNRIKEEWKNDYDYYEAFCSFSCQSTPTNDSQAFRVDLQCEDGIDFWQTPEELTTYLMEWDTGVTYRTFGTPCNIWIRNYKVETNREILFDSYGGPQSVKITTNRRNQTDIFASYSQEGGENCKIMIQQLEP